MRVWFAETQSKASLSLPLEAMFDPLEQVKQGSNNYQLPYNNQECSVNAQC